MAGGTFAGPAAALLLAGALAGPARAAEPQPAGPGAPAVTGELRLRWNGQAANTRGPLAAASRLSPSIAAAPPDAWQAEAELRATGRIGPLNWQGNALVAAQRPEGDGLRSASRLNELHASYEAADWGLSAGKKVVGWDVGYGFRPNDVVQQEARRTLYAETLEGRPLLQWEHFGADSAATLVWVNPQRLNARDAASRGADESALAGRWYQREGAADLHAFARVGAHTGGSAGAAVAWVVTDALELHASARWLQRHDGWRAAPGTLAASNPWSQQTLGTATQWLLGLQWTGDAQQSLMAEVWHDGTALADGGWSGWRRRSAAIQATAAPAAARAGNLAWQATPFDAASLRRDNVFLRAAWQPGPWLVSIDTLWQPADGGRSVTASLQWQGDRVKLNLALRRYGGPSQALMAQLPQRSAAVLAAAWAF